MTRVAITGSVAVLIAGAVLTGCGGQAPKKSETAAAAPVRVQTITVAPGEWSSSHESTGTVRARTAAVISSKVMGYVREVRVQVGDRVKSGQLLVVLDARDLESGYKQAEAGLSEAKSAVPEVANAVQSAQANLELAKVTFSRMKDLFDKRSVSNQEFDEAQARLKMAEANYNMALSKKLQLDSKIRQAEQGVASAGIMRDFSRIEAPFDGVVTEKPVEPGSLAAPGAPLLTLERAGSFRLEAQIPESRIATVRQGQPVTVVLDALNQSLNARVSELVPSVDPASRTFTAKIDLPAVAQLKSGIFGRAVFAGAARQAVTVPAGAVVRHGQVESVLVVDGGIARSRMVTIGERSGDRVEVLSGITAGEKIVHPRTPGLSDGARVEVQP